MNHCGAFIGKAESPANGADSTDRKVEFENCTANNIKLYNVQNGGLFAGYVNGTVPSKEAVQLPVQLHREQLSVVDTRWVD